MFEWRRSMSADVCRRGTVLVAIIALLLIAEVAILGLALNLSRQQHLAVDRLETVRAFYAAEAGMNMAMREVVLNSDEDGDGGIGSISDDGDAGTDPTFGLAGVSVSDSANGLLKTLESHGYASNSERQTRMSLMPETTGLTPGLLVFRYSAVGGATAISEIDWDATPAELGTVTLINLADGGASDLGWPGGSADDWGQHFMGTVTVAQAGTWTFYTESGDGSQLWVDGILVVDNDGVHGMTTVSGSVALTAGAHDIEVKWFDSSGSQGLIVSWSGPGVGVQTVIPASAFTY